jgi:hypothetical protein
MYTRLSGGATWDFGWLERFPDTIQQTVATLSTDFKNPRRSPHTVSRRREHENQWPERVLAQLHRVPGVALLNFCSASRTWVCGGWDV